MPSAPPSATRGHAGALRSGWTASQTLQQVSDYPGCVITPIWGAHNVCDLIRTSSIILFKLYPDTGIILNLFDHFSIATYNYPN